jgi:hypothetical protein
MRIVGDHLAEVATHRSGSIERDLFGRSAFNRYYYAAFLKIRTVLKTIDPIWARPSHQSIPDLLIGDVLKRLKNEIPKAERSSLLTKGEGEQLYRTAANAAADLSSLLASAREIRRLADYEPEIPVTKSGVVMKLGDCTLESAQNWERRVNIQAKIILKTYGKLGLI